MAFFSVTLPNSFVNLTYVDQSKRRSEILWNIIINVCFPDLPKVTRCYYEIKSSRELFK